MDKDHAISQNLKEAAVVLLKIFGLFSDSDSFQFVDFIDFGTTSLFR